jgi:prevent-host-death family protein
MDNPIMSGAVEAPPEATGTAFAAAVDQAVNDKARVVLTRDGKPVAAIVPIEDYDALEAAEDAEDERLAAEAYAAWEAAGRPAGISHEELLARYGIDPG